MEREIEKSVFKAYTSKQNGVHPLALSHLGEDEKLPVPIEKVTYDSDKSRVTVHIGKLPENE